MDLCEHSKIRKFHISARPSIILYLQENPEGSVRISKGTHHSIYNFSEIMMHIECIGTINVLPLSFLGFPVDTSGLFTLNSFYWGKLHHLILTPTIFTWIVHANGKHPRKQCNALSNNKYVQN